MSSAVDGATPLFTVQIDIDWVQIAGRIGGRGGLDESRLSIMKDLKDMNGSMASATCEQRENSPSQVQAPL
jgi:hypothetical protein